MKYLAIILTATLFGIMAFVMMDARSKATSATNQLELFRRQQKGLSEPPPVVSSATPGSASDLELSIQQSKLLSHQVGKGSLPASPSNNAALVDPATTAAPPPLTPRQRQVLAAPAIGIVSDYEKEHGFVIFSAGASRNLEAGMSFAVRRGNAIIGRIKVTSVENASAIADLDSQSVPPGVTLKVGDEVIQDLQPGA